MSAALRNIVRIILRAAQMQACLLLYGTVRTMFWFSVSLSMADDYAACAVCSQRQASAMASSSVPDTTDIQSYGTQRLLQSQDQHQGGADLYCILKHGKSDARLSIISSTYQCWHGRPC